MKKFWSRGRYCLSLLMASALSFTACTEKEDFNLDNNHKLQVTFGVNSHGSRAINRETSLPDGSQVGARLSGYTGYENLVYTASTGKTPQSWTGDKDVVLSDVSGTLYAYYPYNKDIDITAIPVDMTAADQTDWLYGVPATGITDLNPEVDVTMNHALANINLSIVRDTYAGNGEITSISVQSDGIASKGTFNAAQATPGYTAFTVMGEALERSVETTLGATATDIMVIPTGTEAAITFFVTVDDVLYSVKSAPLTLEMGNSYQYTLKLNSTFMSVDGVSVTSWNNFPKEDDLELEEYDEFDAGIVATYYIDEAQFASRAAGCEIKLLRCDGSFSFSSYIDRMKVDGVEVTPSFTYTFTTGGEHTVKFLLKDNTKVPGSMFSHNTNLIACILPETIVNIGNSVFSNCSSLAAINIPNSVTSIGDCAFYKCSKWCSSLDLPDNLIYIYGNAFGGCTGLTGELNLPKSLVSIYEGAFANCSGLSGSLILPNGLTAIWGNEYDDGAFQNCTGLTGELVIPNSVKTIGRLAFANCSGLTGHINIPEGNVSIGERTFQNCKGLTGELVIPNSVKTIGRGAFKGCSGLTGELVIPESVTKIDGNYYYGGAFEGCAGLTKVVIEGQLTLIDVGLFANCTGLTEVAIPNSVEYIKGGAFAYCTNLKSVNIPSSLKSIEVDTYNRGAFQGCKGLTKLILPNSVQTIGKKAFYNCSGLNTIDFGQGVETIDYDAFYGCTGLVGTLTIPNSVKIFRGTEKTGHQGGAFNDCVGLTEVVIGEGIQELGWYLFDGCTNLKSITVLADVAPTIDSSVFYYLKNDNKNVALVIKDDATGYDTSYWFDKYRTITSVYDNGLWYSADGKILYMGEYDISGSCVVKNGVTLLQKNAFKNCTGITEVTIPNSVQTIGDAAFLNCTGITEVNIEAENIGKQAFAGCSGLTEITIGSTVQTIGQSAFGGLYNVKSIFVDNDNATFDSRNNCNAIMETATNTLKVGCVNSFIPEGTEIIGEYAFSNVFEYYTYIYKVDIPEGVKEIQDNAFYFNRSGAGCSLKEISIPNTVETIGKQAFAGCQRAETIKLGSNLKSIGDRAFAATNGYLYATSIISKAMNAPSLGSNVFYNLTTTNKILTVPTGATGYEEWMKNENGYLGYKGWTIEYSDELVSQ